MVALRSPLIASPSPSSAGKNEHHCVLALVPFEEEDESSFVGLLQVEVA